MPLTGAKEWSPRNLRSPTLPGVGEGTRPFRIDRARQAAPQVYDWLRHEIVSLAYAPGMTLSRAELTARFGLSQTPIRDALLRLAAEGLVEIFPQHATRVSRIDLAQAAQAHFLRRSIELEVVRALALAPAKPRLPAVEAIVARQRALLRERDIEAFETADREFHQTLCEAAEVPDLWDLLRSRSGHIDRLRRLDLPMPGKMEAIVASHAAIAAAIAAADAEAAQEALRQHLSGTLSQIPVIRAVYPDYLCDG